MLPYILYGLDVLTLVKSEMPKPGILRSDSFERRLAKRQILVTVGKSKRWFIYVNKILEHHGSA